jgi:hypothetical protein
MPGAGLAPRGTGTPRLHGRCRSCWDWWARRSARVWSMRAPGGRRIMAGAAVPMRCGGPAALPRSRR